MKSLPVAAIACLAILGACSIKEEKTVQQPAPAATVVATPAPSSTVYTTAPPATATTVYTR